jgi:hypothetical protein
VKFPFQNLISERLLTANHSPSCAKCLKLKRISSARTKRKANNGNCDLRRGKRKERVARKTQAYLCFSSRRMGASTIAG